MAKRGRKTETAEEKAAKENARRLAEAGPFATIRGSGRPVKPDSITGCPIASAEWDRLVELLDDRAILAPSDSGVLAAYCSAFSTLVRCRQELNTAGLTSENKRTGAVKAHPLLGVLSGAERSLVSFASELGLSPTARGRVTMVEDLQKTDDLDEFLAGA